jgi:hypothetical protein
MTIFYIHLDGRLMATPHTQQEADSVVAGLRAKHPMGRVSVAAVVETGE